eukprot:175863-Pelagomonas_calceolata.AAC.1
MLSIILLQCADLTEVLKTYQGPDQLSPGGHQACGRGGKGAPSKKHESRGGGQLAGMDFCACSSSWSVWWGPSFQDRSPFLNARGRTWQA